MTAKAEIDAGWFKPRTCQHCGVKFAPHYPNQRVHEECHRLWRRAYQRSYQKKARQDLSGHWEDLDESER